MRIIEVPAVEFHQGKSRHRLFCFAVDGKQISDFATVARVKRSDDSSLLGYQRPEVLNHIKEIRNYLEESPSPMIPNAIVIAFDDRVRFEPVQPNGSPNGRLGMLHIPIPNGDDQSKPGWIVDGQQRTAAIRDAKIAEFPMCVVGFVAANETEQREHFVRVNSAKPLPRDLIFELLPETEGVLSKQLMSKREPAKLAGRLNSDPDSPFFSKIKMPTCPSGIISYAAILRMLENSFRDGVLYEIEALNLNADDDILGFLTDYWHAVAQSFPPAWELPPGKSRLTHGCGLLAMGYLMDEVGHTVGIHAENRRDAFKQELAIIADICAWTTGDWAFGETHHRRWNELQNTHKDIALLTNYLLGEYRRRRDKVLMKSNYD